MIKNKWFSRSKTWKPKVKENRKTEENSHLALHEVGIWLGLGFHHSISAFLVDFCCWVFWCGPYLMVFSAYCWLFTKESSLVGSEEPYGMLGNEPKLALCKGGTIPSVPSFWPLHHCSYLISRPLLVAFVFYPASYVAALWSIVSLPILLDEHTSSSKMDTIWVGYKSSCS